MAKYRPKYCQGMKRYLETLSCPELSWLKILIQELDDERLKRRLLFERMNPDESIKQNESINNS